MLDATKEIVIALINSNQICYRGDVDENINDVKKAIREIYKELSTVKSNKTLDEG